MSKNEEFHNRLDDLFSETEPPRPEPGEDPPPPVGSEIPKRDPFTTALPDQPRDESTFRGGHKQLGWDDFLNAIDRDERIGFAFDQENVSPLDTDGDNGDALQVPLQLGEEIFGALQVEDDDNRSWSQDELDLLSAVAQQVSQHIENLRLLEQAEQYRQEAEQASRRLTLEGWEKYLKSPDAPSSGYVYDLNRVTPFDPNTDVAFAGDSTTLSQALKVREQPIGEIVLSEVGRDIESASSLLTTIADRLSTHIESLRLLEETERSRQQLDKRAAELETVAQVSTAAATLLAPRSLLQSVMDLTRYSFKLYYSSVYLLDELGDTLELTAASGKIGQEMLAVGHKIRLDQKVSNVAKAARTRQTIIVADSEKDADFLAHDLLPDTRSEMTIPMVVADQLIGVFDVEADVVNRFTEEDARTYETLAAQTAVALRNAQLYAEQMETVERLRELDHLKSAFLANMSHELRTPLNSILGFAQVMIEGLDGPLTDDMQMDLALIEKNGQHLLQLINDVLDMAKIEAGRVTLSFEPVDMHDLLEDVLRTNSPLARDRQLSLEIKKGFEGSAVIMADTIRLRQVLINLIGNAIKFTDQGGVTIETEKANQKLQIRVRDTGIGIPPEKLEAIFEAFSQIDTSTTRKVSGTGLGLPISRRLVEMHSGRLWAESTGVPGKGSVFCLELPVDVTGELTAA
jgi:signal transduction histidine kinase